MGWLDNPIEEIKREGGNAVNTARNTVQEVGNTNRGALGSFGYLSPLAPHQLASDYFNQEDKKKEAEAQAAEAQAAVDRAVTAADKQRAQQQLFAAQLKANATRDTGLLTNQVAGNERRAMADKIREAKQNASSRGLIGSGFQKSNEARARAEAAGNTASKQKQIQDLSMDQIRDAEDLSAQLGLEMGGVQQNMSDQYYRMAVENMQRRNQSYSDVLGAGARVGGTYLGNKQAQKNWWEV